MGDKDEEIIELKSTQKAEELSGKLDRNDEEEEQKLMHSVMENDTDTINDGKLLNEAINQGTSTFTPDLMFEQLVQNYSLAEKIHGKRLIRLISGYDPSYVKRNINIPEFARILKQELESKFQNMKKKGIVDGEGFISDKGIKLASLILYTEELDNLIPTGILGEKTHKKSFIYGDREDYRNYRKGDRYKDFAINKAIKVAIRRGHTKVEQGDFRTYERKSKGSVSIIYALDASGSMKGKKIETAKKAGIALAYKAIQGRDKVGLVVFGDEIKEELSPCLDFMSILEKITKIKASKETDMTQMIKRSISLFERGNMTKHLLLITDALPTVGNEPEEETLVAVSIARSYGITISVIGIGLDEQGSKFAEKVARFGEGRLYIVKNLKEMDKIVLEEYYAIS